ncbi:SUKH-3 domain-containing protein [Streptomyces sp. NBC_01716]|uniref:SUKH-3 domain-containing protein n=1 Tax=Streptomyces sp. NBC_01716 TaxID=2975917 RepID=UPI002E3786CD|nr:SUKH-3 domain-containing protein [Streptomyces sp. NBC_01716]
MPVRARDLALEHFRWISGHADVWAVFRDARALAAVVTGLVEPFRGEGITAVCGIEARGFLLGGAAAVELGVGFVPVRKGEGLFPGDKVEVESDLRRAGWVPDRRVNLVRWKAAMQNFAWNAAAGEFFAEFGGIRVENDGPGITCARESFEFDPELAIGEEGRFSELSEFFGLG